MPMRAQPALLALMDEVATAKINWFGGRQFPDHVARSARLPAGDE